MDDTLYQAQQAEYKQLSQYLAGKLSTEQGSNVELELTENQDGSVSASQAERALEALRIKNRVIKEKYRGLITPTIRANAILTERLERQIHFIIQKIDNREERYAKELTLLKEKARKHNEERFQTKPRNAPEVRNNTIESLPRSGAQQLRALQQGALQEGNPQYAATNKSPIGTEIAPKKPGRKKNTSSPSTEEEEDEDDFAPQQAGGQYFYGDNNSDDESDSNLLEEKLVQSLTANGFDGKELLKEASGKTKMEKIKNVIRSARANSGFYFPVFTLSAALCIDLLEAVKVPLDAVGVGTAFAIIAGILKWGLFAPFVWINTINSGDSMTKKQIRRFLRGALAKRIYFFVLNPLIELVPVLGSFWPGTFLFVLLLVNSRNVLAQNFIKSLSVTKDPRFQKILNK